MYLDYKELQQQLEDLKLECESLRNDNDELKEKLPAQVSNIVCDVWLSLADRMGSPL